MCPWRMPYKTRVSSSRAAATLAVFLAWVLRRAMMASSDLLRQGGAAAGSWKAGSCRARLAQREKSLGWLTLGSVHAGSG